MYGLLVCAVLGASLAEAPPNVVVVIADDLGYGDLGCYGSREIRTHHIDQLAAAGVRLTSCYAAAPVCSPTRAAFLTGRYPQKAGFEWVIRYTEKDRGLAVEESILAKSLHDAGYATAIYGKWHLGYARKFGPNAHGFDDFFGFLAADLDYYSHKDALGDPGLYENETIVERKGYLTDLITQHAEEFIVKNASKPFFLVVSYNAPHWPFQPPGKPDERTSKTYGPENGTRADYVGMVESLDEAVGRVLKKLDDVKLRDNTLVVFFSDNGGERLSDGGPLFHGKYSLWEGGIRVPCLVSWPGVVPQGVESNVPIITMDLTATILAAAGAKAPANLDGEDLVPWITGKKEAIPRTLFWRLPRPSAKFGQRAVRSGRWKFIEDRDNEFLFDIENDIGERKNLAFQHPEIVKELKTALLRWEATLPRLAD